MFKHNIQHSIQTSAAPYLTLFSLSAGNLTFFFIYLNRFFFFKLLKDLEKFYYFFLILF